MRSSLLPIVAAAALLAGATTSQAASYAIDPGHTYVTFEISHFGTSTNRGRFDKKEGSVVFDRAAKSGKVEITVDNNRIVNLVGNPRLINTFVDVRITAALPHSLRDTDDER